MGISSYIVQHIYRIDAPYERNIHIKKSVNYLNYGQRKSRICSYIKISRLSSFESEKIYILNIYRIVVIE